MTGRPACSPSKSADLRPWSNRGKHRGAQSALTPSQTLLQTANSNTQHGFSLHPPSWIKNFVASNHNSCKCGTEEEETLSAFCNDRCCDVLHPLVNELGITKSNYTSVLCRPGPSGRSDPLPTTRPFEDPLSPDKIKQQTPEAIMKQRSGRAQRYGFKAAATSSGLSLLFCDGDRCSARLGSGRNVST